MDFPIVTATRFLEQDLQRLPALVDNGLSYHLSRLPELVSVDRKIYDHATLLQ
jgi:hypothetical protein